MARTSSNGEFNHSHLPKTVSIPAEASSLAIPPAEDDAEVRSKYRPFLQHPEVTNTDWISQLELDTVLKLASTEIHRTGHQRLRVLVLYGSLRSRSYSRLLAFECARILWRLGCDVRVFNPSGLPVKDDSQQGHDKVQELRALSQWSDGHVWVSPEQHGNLVCCCTSSVDM